MRKIRKVLLLRFLAAVMLIAVLGFFAACATRPLVLSPRFKPMDFPGHQQYGALDLMQFEDGVPAAAWGNKRFQEQPIQVFNDSLLNVLRQSQKFKSVSRGVGTEGGQFKLSGILLSLSTDESSFKIGLVPSTMEITATCTSTFRLINTVTGAVLLEETVTTRGRGAARMYGGGQHVQYDSTLGYEESMSHAISENVARISQRVVEALSKQ